MLLHLEDAGVFPDVGSMAVETKFLPGLYQMVTQQIKNTAQERCLAAKSSDCHARGCGQHSGCQVLHLKHLTTF